MIMRQMGVALPDDLRARIEAAALANDRSVGAEIRFRLRRSFAEEMVKEFVAAASAIKAEAEAKSRSRSANTETQA